MYIYLSFGIIAGCGLSYKMKPEPVGGHSTVCLNDCAGSWQLSTFAVGMNLIVLEHELQAIYFALNLLTSIVNRCTMLDYTAP